MVENMIISMAQRGQIPGKLGEPALINILESINQQMSKNSPSVKVSGLKKKFQYDIFINTIFYVAKTFACKNSIS